MNPPRRPADPRPGGVPAYIPNCCDTCKGPLGVRPNNKGWEDEFICPVCHDGVYLDTPLSDDRNRRVGKGQQLRTLAKKKGWHLYANGRGLFDANGNKIAGQTEDAFFGVIHDCLVRCCSDALVIGLEQEPDVAPASGRGPLSEP